ncbi:MAG: NUDIX hydrolase [Bacteroidales bacterium]|nr:NUDIX hydrolase [Bacteroidales bacterium]
MSTKLLDISKQLLSIAQSGLTFSENKYDLDRYKQIKEIALKLMEQASGIPFEKLSDVFAAEKGYLTPKVDIRGVVFRDDKILMVQETIDGHWSLPGGWADVGFTPFEIAKKEVFEESGLIVHPDKLLAVLDKRSHAHPPDIFHIYKIFILCSETGGKMTIGLETSDVGFFSLDELPPLSLNRITREQIELMFEYKNNPGKPAFCD